MERPLPLRTDGSAAVRWGIGLLWSLPFLALFAWHGWMTLTLFGADNRWEQLLDDRPIISGRHPFHLYHAYLAARSFRERGTVCCFDPAFQAGYPKTPVFDDADRPAELFLTLTGAEFRPAAYKIGFAICCLMAPLLLLMAARGIGLGAGTCFLATAAGLLVWWGTPCRQLLEAGDLDLLLAGLAVVAGAGMLIHFHRAPEFRSWAGLFVSGCIGWFAQPLVFVLLLPLALVYYLSVGAKHRLAWHVALLAAFSAGLAVNCFWLVDWFSYWWIRSPFRGPAPVLAHRTFHTLWSASLWGEVPDRALAGILLFLAFIGACVFNETNQRSTARIFGLGSVGFLVLAMAGVAWEPLARLGTSRLLVPALWLAAVPAAHALVQTVSFVAIVAGSVRRTLVLALGLVAVVAITVARPLAGFVSRLSAAAPFAIGLTPEQLGWVKAIEENTTPDARILWQEDTGQETGSHWTALLPILTGRSYIGGLDPNACIEYAYPCLNAQTLAGRPLAQWSATELSDFYRRYNIGWVVCRSPGALACLKDYQEAQPILFMESKDPCYLFQLKPRSYVLRGQARLIEANSRHIAFADVVPDQDGKVVISMHYQTGMRVSPSRVQIEKESDPRDPIDFIRLKLQGPVARVTITWQPEK